MTSISTHPRSRSAFTLLEVLVTCAILTLLLAILLSIFSASLTLWRDTDSKIYADREARVARLLMGHDLANAILPSNSTTTLWPQVTTEGNSVYLQFLTKADANYQTEEGDDGDICFVEYAINSDSKTLTRRFLGSQRTYSEILLPGRFPAPGSGSDEEVQMLATNLLPENTFAIRGLDALEREMPNRKFILLTGTDLLPNQVTDTNPPRAIEVNFAVTDPDSATDASIQLMESDPNFVLKDGGLYSFRVFLPPPAESNPAP